jgi:hypothetical protein
MRCHGHAAAFTQTGWLEQMIEHLDAGWELWQNWHDTPTKVVLLGKDPANHECSTKSKWQKNFVVHTCIWHATSASRPAWLRPLSKTQDGYRVNPIRPNQDAPESSLV